MKTDELVKRLCEYTEWARANEWEVPITLADALEAAADTIERLDNFADSQCCRLLEKLQKADAAIPRWISVKDRLPEPGEIVLVHQVYSWKQFEDGVAVTVGRLRPTENGRVSYWEFQYYRPDFRDGTVLDNGIICPGNEYITHWMPLPSAEELK